MTDNSDSTELSPPSIQLPSKFKKGRKKTGGRKKGVPNINTEIHKGAMRRIRDTILDSGGAIKTPAEFLVDVYNDDTNKMSDRIHAAKIVSSIIHPNAPKVVNVKGGTSSKIEFSLLASDAHNNFERLVNLDMDSEMDKAIVGDIIDAEVVEVEKE